jgi:protein TonB
MAYERCGSYVLLRELASEALGPTYRAGHVSGHAVDRVVLLRRLAAPGVETSVLLREVEARRDLPQRTRSPFVPDLVEAGSCNGQPFLAYDYQPGLSAGALLATANDRLTPLPPDLGAVIADRAAQTLLALHGAGLGQTLVVPELLWVSSEGDVRLHGAEAGVVLRGVAGRLPALAPFLSLEARTGERPRESDDVWSLGMLLATLLTGKVPASPDPDGAWLATAMLPDDEGPLPEPLAELLGRSLAPRPRRLAKVEAWHQALGRALELVGWRSTPFQLAVFMHNLLKSELAREPQELEREREEALRPSRAGHAPPPAASAPVAGASTTPHAVIPQAAPAPVAPRATPPAPAGPRLLSALGREESDGPGRRSWAPLGIAAGILLLVGGGLYFAFGRPQGPATPGARSGAPPAPTPAAAATAAVAAATPAPTASPLVTPSPALRSPAELEQRLAALLAERQRTIDERYAREIAELREQLAETRRAPPPARESAAEPAPDAPPAGAGPSAAEEPADPPPVPAPAATTAEVRAQASSGVPPSSALPAPLVPPKLLRFDPPDYPPVARRRNVQGTVILSVHVSPRGEVTAVRFVRRVREDVGINEAAEAAARRARFTPATRGGVPVGAWYTLTIPFQL